MAPRESVRASLSKAEIFWAYKAPMSVGEGGHEGGPFSGNILDLSGTAGARPFDRTRDTARQMQKGFLSNCRAPAVPHNLTKHELLRNKYKNGALLFDKTLDIA